jgi:hypothetical protein
MNKGKPSGGPAAVHTVAGPDPKGLAPHPKSIISILIVRF